MKARAVSMTSEDGFLLRQEQLVAQLLRAAELADVFYSRLGLDSSATIFQPPATAAESEVPQRSFSP